MTGSNQPDASTAPAPEASAPARSAHILVVDDKEIVRTFLMEVLELAGHRGTVVEDGDKALEVVSLDRADVLVTDLRMEPVSGEELIRQLKTVSPSTVPIVLTGYGSVERTVELMRMGAFDVLTKPCRATEILATVEKALAQAGLTPADIDVFLPHQANIRIIEAVCQRLDVDMELTHNVIEHTGNTSSASIPLTLAEAHERGALAPGAIVCMTGFGAGMAWASAVLQW